MEKLTLTPHAHEIIVNSGATDGAVDMFSYGPDDASTRNLGSLFIIGHRDTDSSNAGYMVSLIAALAKREYYGQASPSPRESFAKTLRKVNEVVDEFFHAGDVKLSVGIVAVAGGTIMVSKLDKFKIFLARENQVIDIMSNVLLFSKEHTERRRFSSIIHGSVQAGDRILAFVPSRAVSLRERNVKGWLMKLPQPEFAERIAHIGSEYATFATAMLHIDIAQTSEPAHIPETRTPSFMPGDTGFPPVSLAQQPSEKSRSPIPWTPRQHATHEITSSAQLATNRAHEERAHPPVEELEAPRIIPAEFSLGMRRTLLSRWYNRMRFMRLDQRGKAIALGVVALLTIGTVATTRSFIFGNPTEERQSQALEAIRTDAEIARTKIAQNEHSEARRLLSQALASLIALNTESSDAHDLRTTISSTLDSIDNAQNASMKLIASPQPEALSIALAGFSSASQSLWIGGISEESEVWMASIQDGVIGTRIATTLPKADRFIGWMDSIIAIDLESRTLSRLVGTSTVTYTIPVAETLLDVAEYNDSIYILTDRTILKISDLDTLKPVTKRWLTKDDELAVGAQRIWVDGDVWTMSPGGTLTSYYKGELERSIETSLSASGVWQLLSAPDGLLAVALGTDRRVYHINPKDGTLARTLKIDSLIPFSFVSQGPDNSVLMTTSESKVWQVQ